MTDVSPGSAFAFPGRSGTPILANIAVTTPVQVAGDSTRAMQIVWFQVTEIAGGTGNLTIDIYDANTSTAYVLQPLAAMTAKAQYFYGRGFWLNPNQFLRITTGTINTASVIGLATIPQQLA